jgi:hypothetical protein
MQQQSRRCGKMERFRADFEPRGAFGYNFRRPFLWLG